jgi:hypothetical protein
VITLTLDTSAVLHGVQRQAFAEHVDSLVDLARAGVAGIWITSAFEDDQLRASDPNRRANLEWLAERPCIGEVPGPFRLDYSVLGGKDVLVDDRAAELGSLVERIVLPPSLWPGSADPQAVSPATWRKRLIDVQHLVAHVMAGHDLFVTTDQDDILRKRNRLLSEVGIRVVDPLEAIQHLLQDARDSR